MKEFDGLERELGDSIDMAIIWLHGLGADASDFLPLIGELGLGDGIRFVFPNAPVRPVTINGGMRMRTWYDVAGFGPDAPEDKDGLTASAGAVRRLIEREVNRGLQPQRVFLVGFSQGGAVVLHAGLGAEPAPGGILGLSTYLPAPELLKESVQLAADVPVWLAHGTHDPVIPLALAESSARYLAARGVDVDWSVYPMGHEVCLAEIRDLSAWLRHEAAR